MLYENSNIAPVDRSFGQAIDDDDDRQLPARHSVDQLRQIHQQITRGFRRRQPRAGGVGDLETGWHRTGSMRTDGPVDAQVRSIMGELGERSEALVTVRRADADADRVTVRDGNGAVQFERLVRRGTADDVAEEFNPLPFHDARALADATEQLEWWAARRVASAELLEADFGASSVEVDAESAAATRLHQAMAQRLDFAPDEYEVRDDEDDVWDGIGSGTVEVLLQNDYTPDHNTPDRDPTKMEVVGYWHDGIFGGSAGWRDDDADEPWINVPISARALAEDLGLA